MVYVPPDTEVCEECHHLACAHDAGAVRAPWIYTAQFEEWHDLGHPDSWVENRPPTGWA